MFQQAYFKDLLCNSIVLLLQGIMQAINPVSGLFFISNSAIVSAKVYVELKGENNEKSYILCYCVLPEQTENEKHIGHN